MKKHSLVAACTIALLLMGGIMLHQLKITPRIIAKLTPLMVRECYQTIFLKEPRELLTAPETITGKLITLKKLRFSHFESYYPILSNPYCTDIFFTNPDTLLVPLFDMNHYLYQELVLQYFGKTVMYSVFDNKTNTVAGMIQIIHVKDRTDKRQDHYALSGFARPSQWGTGSAAETLNAITRMFFSISKKNAIYGNALAHNHRCQTFLTKCGFNFSHVCEDEDSKNELVFVLTRPKEFTL